MHLILTERWSNIFTHLRQDSHFTAYCSLMFFSMLNCVLFNNVMILLIFSFFLWISYCFVGRDVIIFDLFDHLSFFSLGHKACTSNWIFPWKCCAKRDILSFPSWNIFLQILWYNLMMIQNIIYFKSFHLISAIIFLRCKISWNSRQYEVHVDSVLLGCGLRSIKFVVL